jgi:hypothetical protein
MSHVVRKGAAMKLAALVALVLLGSVLGAGDVRAQCELSCNAECKQEDGVCKGEATLNARIGKAECALESGDMLLECEAGHVAAKTDCVGLCGDELSACGKAAKDALKACKAEVKAFGETCKRDVDETLGLDRVSCAEDVADCLDFCRE